MSKQTVLLRGDPSFQEKQAVATITPGMLVELTAADKVQANSTAADTVAAPSFAMEDVIQGREVIDDYAADEIVRYITASKGDRVEGIANAAIALGAAVESAGNGKLRTLTAGRVVGIAKIAAAALDDRIEIEIA